MRDVEIFADLPDQTIPYLVVPRYRRGSIVSRMYEYRVAAALAIENAAVLP